MRHFFYLHVLANIGVNSGSLPNNVYQQLVLLQAQQQQQQQQTTVSALPQQFNSALHLVWQSFKHNETIF